ncbi:MvaI/BcnI restriction endonuclease family protein [Loktanella sp. D2R18]|uniref:MvaI/BcnI family restriction endonuclease n=1 Tax=Rhodobacterales TaxID=204455 RepID=UPI000DE9043E|nr:MULTISPECIES: MvaI/BcnI family restriction endonuclease [Rhodobacterales]MDO6590179.1 MvaI/BcnI family restriction endonuclease [Yoonia sp. 1_MG-2023]RBW42993.1 MvaI/BcnI restriction endonuclease family protein [Loktanella sp. D2R18]
MPLRTLTEIERSRIKRLTAESVEITLIQPTKTGLEKAILDATAPVRNFLKDHDLHDYEFQGQGASEHGVKLEAVLLNEHGSTRSTASLYRPRTKSGDPRIWFTKLPAYADPDDIMAIMVHEGRLAVLNLTKVNIDHVLDVQRSGALWELLTEIGSEATELADELLEKLRAISRNGLVASVMDARADTAIGRTLETALGIAMNSAKEPDYKGIELKSYRRRKGSRENRKTLFAQVPNWDISKFKSSREILDNFGYWREADFKLYCTTSTRTRNSQGLSFALDEKAGTLNELSDQREIGAFASWYMADLRDALLKKHNETFWIGADVRDVSGHDHFRFRDVIHTRKPIASQFDILVEQGEITMDHLIKRNAKGRVSEKGPLFKINSPSLELLFPPSKTYALA